MMLPYERLDQFVVSGKARPHLAAVAFPQTRAGFDIGKQKGQRA
jgi:hypothetical protein